MNRFVALVPLLVGCAPALSTFQPAHVAEKGHVQIGAGVDVSIPTGTIKKVIDVAEPIARQAASRALTADEQRQVFDAAVNVAANPPSFGPHVGVAYVPLERFEVGIRYVGGGWRLGARYQILKKDEHGIDLTLGAGASRFAYEFPLANKIPYVEVDDFTRYQFDFPLLFGKSGDWYRWWAGPKFMVSTFRTAMRIDAPRFQSEVASFKGTAGYYGGQAGVALGYKKVFFGFELTMAQLFGHADTTLLGAATRTDINSFIVYPSVGLLGEF
jgi:hypothetical protein